MNNAVSYILQLISLLFILSCNTEARFGFREKVKVDNHPIVNVIRKRVDILKTEAIAVDTKNIETITSSAYAEKRVAVFINQTKTQIPIINLSGKIISETFEKKFKSPDPIIKEDNRIRNELAYRGFIYSLTVFLAWLGLIFCVIALVEIFKNPNKYKGKGYAIAGIAVCVFWFIAGLLLR